MEYWRYNISDFFVFNHYFKEIDSQGKIELRRKNPLCMKYIDCCLNLIELSSKQDELGNLYESALNKSSFSVQCYKEYFNTLMGNMLTYHVN